eukprot:6704666-Pyramimonas_sp.AAC.1
MLGSAERCTATNIRHPGGGLKAKAGEMSVLLNFAVHELLVYGGAEVFTDAFVTAGSTMVQFLDTIRGMGVVVRPEEREALVGLSGIFLRACEASGVSHVPKHHLVVHLADRTSGISIPRYARRGRDGGWSRVAARAQENCPILGGVTVDCHRACRECESYVHGWTYIDLDMRRRRNHM